MEPLTGKVQLIPNVGDGDAQQRMAAALFGMVHATNPVTRWSCRQIVAAALVREPRK